MNKVCRLCGGNVDLIDLFRVDNDRTLKVLRHTICVASGIVIKPDDIVSKMVCQRCCEIAIKLHKYRTNALANDEVLKAQYGQSYLTSKSNHDDNSQLSSNTCKTKYNSFSSDPVDFVNTTIKKEFGICQSTTNEIGQVLSDKSIHAEASAIPPNTLPTKAHTVVVVKEKYKHPSVRNLFKENQNYIIPEEVLGEDISPVISLDEAEVTDWYEEQFENVKQKLSTITFKKVANSNVATITTDLKNVISSSSALLNNLLVTSKLGQGVSTINNKSVQHDTLNNSNQSVCEAAVPVSTDTTTTVKKTDNKFVFPKAKRKKSAGGEIQNHNTTKFSAISSISATIDHVISQNIEKVSSLSLLKSSDGYQIKTKFEESVRNNRKEMVARQLSTNTNKGIPILQKAKKHTAKISRPKPREIIVQRSSDDITLPNLLLSSNSVIPSIPKARKRTAKRIPSGQKDREVNPKKKNRRYFNNDNVTDSKELDTLIPLLCHENSRIQPLDFAASKTLTDLDNLLVLSTGKSLNVFICTVCSVVCDTKKQLVDHEKSHLTCSFCKIKIKNMQLLEEHLKDTCIINVMKNDVRVPLVRVDAVPSILNKYADAFKNVTEDSNVVESYKNDSENDDIGIDDIGNDDIGNDDIGNYDIGNYDIGNDDIGNDDIGNDDNGNDDIENYDNGNDPSVEEDLIDTDIKDKDFTVEYGDLGAPNDIYDMESTNLIKEIKSENIVGCTDVVCISDDSDSEIEFTIVPRHTIINMSDVKDGEQSQTSTRKQRKRAVVDLTANEVFYISFHDLARQYTSEMDMIKTLFKKSYHGLNKSEKCCQTFTARNKNIKQSASNMIILTHMYSELLIYRIPVYYESRPSIGVRFGTSPEKSKLNPLEYWGHKEPKTIVELKVMSTAKRKGSGMNIIKNPTTTGAPSTRTKNVSGKKKKKVSTVATHAAIKTDKSTTIGHTTDVKTISVTDSSIETVYSLPTVQAPSANELKISNVYNPINSETNESSLEEQLLTSSTVSNCSTSTTPCGESMPVIIESLSSNTELVPATNLVQLTSNPSPIQYAPTILSTASTNSFQLIPTSTVLAPQNISSNTELVPATNLVQLTSNPSPIQYESTILSTASTNSFQLIPTSTVLAPQNNLIMNNNVTQLNQILVVSSDLGHSSMQMEPIMGNILFDLQNAECESVQAQNSITNETERLTIEEVTITDEPLKINDVD